MFPRVDSLRSRNALRSNQSNSASCESQNDSAGQSGGTSVNSSSLATSEDCELSSSSSWQAILRSVAMVQAETKESRSTGGMLKGEKQEKILVMEMKMIRLNFWNLKSLTRLT